MLVHAAHLPHRSWAVVESLIWVACSHSLLIVLVIAYLIGGPDRVASMVMSVRQDHAVAVHRGISALLDGFGALLLADVIGVVTTGHWFFEIYPFSANGGADAAAGHLAANPLRVQEHRQQ